MARCWRRRPTKVAWEVKRGGRGDTEDGWLLVNCWLVLRSWLYLFCWWRWWTTQITSKSLTPQNFRLLVALDLLGVMLQLPAMHFLRHLPGWTALAALILRPHVESLEMSAKGTLLVVACASDIHGQTVDERILDVLRMLTMFARARLSKNKLCFIICQKELSKMWVKHS